MLCCIHFARLGSMLKLYFILSCTVIVPNYYKVNLNLIVLHECSGLSLDHQSMSGASRVRLSEREEECLSCYLMACDAGLLYLQELDKVCVCFTSCQGLVYSEHVFLCRHVSNCFLGVSRCVFSISCMIDSNLKRHLAFISTDCKCKNVFCVYYMLYIESKIGTFLYLSVFISGHHYIAYVSCSLDCLHAKFQNR